MRLPDMYFALLHTQETTNSCLSEESEIAKYTYYIYITIYIKDNYHFLPKYKNISCLLESVISVSSKTPLLIN
jgi:hypothetical protein